MIRNEFVTLSPEVEEAKRSRKPIVALESTIISHGMPYPQNVETALNCVGLTEEQIDYLGREGHKVTKASRRDLPMLIAKRMDGATTVAATMIAAASAGVRVFATGGIGGVHRGAETTMDISADLEELAQTPVCVVCAGAKSILDLNLTMEYLETKGVPVIGFGTDELPASELPKEIAKAICAARELGYPGGMLVVNPIPEEYSMDADVINKAIDEAVAEANANGIKGKETTPYLLAKIKDITGGSSLSANIQLVYNNVKLAAQIAAGI